MTTRYWLGIYFLLDEKEYAFRDWERVPYVGTLIVFSPDSITPFKVKQVIWHETSDSKRPYADVVIERISP